MWRWTWNPSRGSTLAATRDWRRWTSLDWASPPPGRTPPTGWRSAWWPSSHHEHRPHRPLRRERQAEGAGQDGAHPDQGRGFRDAEEARLDTRQGGDTEL